jgi:uncharacterized protein (DUF4415 family)
MQHRSDLSHAKLREILMEKSKPTIDSEMADFEAALLRSIDQVQAGKGRATTPVQIMARRGRPVGTAKAAPKVATTIRLSPDVSAAFRATGTGWQTVLMQR